LYFQDKTQSCIHKHHNVYLLRILSNVLKANASAVPSVLGRGTFRHFSLFITPVQYVTLSAVPFDCPINPGPISLPQML